MKKTVTMLLPMLALFMWSCNDEEVLMRETSSYKNAVQNNVSVFTYSNGGNDVKMLRFKSVMDYEQTLESLREQQSNYEENFITNYLTINKDTVPYVVYDAIGLDEDFIVKNFEQSFNFTNSMRKAYRKYEAQWESNEKIDTVNTPMLKFPFCDENLSLVNSLGEVMIGDTIFKFTNDGYIAITDGDIKTLIAYNNGDYSVLSNKNVETNILYTNDCLYKKSSTKSYIKPFYGTYILIGFTQKFSCNSFGLASNGRAHAILDTRILLRGKKGLKWYKAGLSKKVKCNMDVVNTMCNKTGKTKTNSKTSKKYKLDVVCTAWHTGVNYFKVINGTSVYGEFSTLNFSDAKYLSW